MSAYNFRDEITVVVKGRVITGYSGEGLAFGKLEDNIEQNVGAEGEVLTNIHFNPLGYIDLTVKANSPSIPFLNQIANSKRPVPISARRRGTVTEEAGGTSAYCTKPAEARFGRNAEDRTFRFLVEDYFQK